MKIRHPEKQNKPINPIKKKPDWIRSKLVNSKEFFLTKTIVNKNNLVTVCQEANCPNITECWSKRHATFMIMGDTCTRACAFCDVKTGKPGKLDNLEPIKISQAVKKLNLKHVVITSVDRDDLDDGGSNHFFEVINQTRKTNPNTTIEVLTPDFLRKGNAYKKVLEANPDVFNHNIETVPSLYLKVRPGSRYFASLELLKNAKMINKKIFTKSGIMVGLGEKKDEILQVMDDLKAADVDFLTIGQYLQPSVKHFPLDKYYTPQEFEEFASIAKSKGFLFMDSPGYDPASVTGQIATGCNLVSFTTGRGSAFGSKPSPSIKIATNTEMYEHMKEDMDVNAGKVVTNNESIETVGSEIFDLLVRVASGEKSKSEKQGLGDLEFVPWQIGATM